MIYSKETERHVLSGIMKYPDALFEIERFVDADCFKVSVHKIIFNVLKENIYSKKSTDYVVIGNKIDSLSINIPLDFSIFDYLKTMSLAYITKPATIEAAKELVKLKGRRVIEETAKSISEFVQKNGTLSYDKIVETCERMFVDSLQVFNMSNDAEEIFGELERDIEIIAEKEQDEGSMLYGPFETANKIYGPLLCPSNYTVIGARSGTGKTAIGTFYTTWVAEKYDLPVLHLDFGEMTKEQIQVRTVSMFSENKIPLYYVKTGKWKKNKEMNTQAKRVWEKAKNIKYYYKNIASFTPDEVLLFIKKFYYKNVKGRINKFGTEDDRFIVHYDYLKPFDITDFNTSEWKQMGHFMQSIKTLITEDVPSCAFWTSLQLNRKGITRNRDEVDDSEDTFGLSDRITQQSYFSFILREKLDIELGRENKKFGNMVMIPVKMRDLVSEDAPRAYERVKISEGNFRTNYLNIQKDGFSFQEVGDLRGTIEKLKNPIKVDNSSETDELNDEI